jgi:3-methyladenine DNA glycosylase Tag
MKSFDSIYQRAARRKGGEIELKKLLPQVPPTETIADLDESRFLAEMSRCLFQAGFIWRVINQKWPGFEEVFHGFDPNIILGLQADEWEEIGKDARIVRKQQNIRAVRANARFIEDIALEHGSFSQFIADWPTSDLIGLFAILKKRGSRLGGNTGPRFLRNIGKDTFVLAPDVVRCLQNNGVEISNNPSTKRDLTRMQEIFNQWHEQTLLPYTHLSKIAAFSIG